MHPVTFEQLADILEVMIIDQTIDSGFAITHHGQIEGRPTVVISTMRGDSGYSSNSAVRTNAYRNRKQST